MKEKQEILLECMDVNDLQLFNLKFGFWLFELFMLFAVGLSFSMLFNGNYHSYDNPLIPIVIISCNMIIMPWSWGLIRVIVYRDHIRISKGMFFNLEKNVIKLEGISSIKPVKAPVSKSVKYYSSIYHDKLVKIISNSKAEGLIITVKDNKYLISCLDAENVAKKIREIYGLPDSAAIPSLPA